MITSKRNYVQERLHRNCSRLSDDEIDCLADILGKLEEFDKEKFDDRRVIDVIKESIWENIGISPDEIDSKSRLRDIVEARYIMWSVFYSITGCKKYKMAKLFAWDRTTILHGMNQAKDMMIYGDFRYKYNTIYNEVSKRINEERDGQRFYHT